MNPYASDTGVNRVLPICIGSGSEAFGGKGGHNRGVVQGGLDLEVGNLLYYVLAVKQVAKEINS